MVSAAPPKGCNSFWVSHLSMLLVFLFLGYLHYERYVFNGIDVRTSDILFLISLFIYAAPIITYEALVLKAYKRPTAGVSFALRRHDAMRILTKLFGFFATIGVVVFFYWLFPEYNKDLYQLFFRLCREWLPYTIPVIILYFSWMDGHLENPEDEYWHAGLFFLGRWNEVDKAKLGHHARSWLIKAFFLPMMLSYLYGNYGFVIGFSFDYEQGFFRYFDFLITLLYIADLVPACAGYILNMKLFDNNIRSTDNTIRGWLFCLMCYTPIWHILMYSNYLPYMDGYNWTNWLGDSDFKYFWAGLIVISLILYSSASVCFGSRWSNLTYRGLMSSGPYRLTKHPAYVFKNLSWWLISVPFIVDGTLAEAIRQLGLILVVNFIYYQRAITEERHLSQWPEYRDYANWMNENGLFRKFGKWVPVLRYDAARYGY